MSATIASITIRRPLAKSPFSSKEYQLGLEFTYNRDGSEPYWTLINEEYPLIRVWDESTPDRPMILETDGNMYPAFIDIVGNADSQSAEDGEVAHQIFNVKKERSGSLLVFHALCEMMPDENYENNIPATTSPYLAANKEDALFIIHCIFDMVAEAFDKAITDIYGLQMKNKPRYVGYMVGSKEDFPFENSLIPGIRKSIPILTVKRFDERSALTCVCGTILYYKAPAIPVAQ